MKTRFLKIFSAVLVSVLTCSFIACGGAKRDKSKINDFELSYYTKSDYIESIDWIGQITGEDCDNKTYSRFNVGGCDLGIPVYNSKNDTMYVFFGDTFMSHTQMSGDWRSNVCLTSKDFDLHDGLTFDGAIMDKEKENCARAIIDGLHQDGVEVTKIPTGGIEINGNLYMFFFDKNSWSVGKQYSMNYGGCVKSTDNGKTWEKFYELTWADHLEVQKTGQLSKTKLEWLINLDIDNKESDKSGDIDITEHVGYYFTQIAPVDGKDGYVYILGEGGYRETGIKLGRVKKENFEKFNEYEYFVGTEANGNPVWEKGFQGLETADYSDDAFIINAKCGEHSVMYNEFLKKWLVTYLGTSGIVMRIADNIYGPYSREIPILEYSDVGQVCPKGYQLTSIYGGFMNEEWTEGNGRVMYVTFSQYKPFYNSSLLRIQFYEDMAG